MRFKQNATRSTSGGHAARIAILAAVIAVVAIGRRLLGRPAPRSQGPYSASGKSGTTDQKEGWARVAVFIVFVPFAFIEEFLQAAFEAVEREQPPWALLAADTVLLGLILWLRTKLVDARDRGLLRWWAGGAVLTLVLDVAVTWNWVLHDTIPGDLMASLLYAVALAILFAATIGADPWRMLTHSGRGADPEAWERFSPGLPLLVGTLAAYVGSVIYWHELEPGAMRTAADWRIVEMSGGLTAAEVDALCVGAIDQQYFAQLSQVIPLLLVAVGLEAGFFAPFLRESVPRAMTIFTFMILCVGEVLAISALPEPNQGCGEILYGLHEYAAFILTLEACFVALATLVWALVVARSKDREDPATDTQNGAYLSAGAKATRR